MHLSLKHLAQEGLVRASQVRDAARPVLAAGDRLRAFEAAIVTRTDTAAVEILGAVRHGRRPLANDRPELIVAEVGQLRAVSARIVDVSLLRARILRVREDLVDMRVDRDALEVGLRHEIRPVRQVLEGIVNELDGVARLAGAVGVTANAEQYRSVRRGHGIMDSDAYRMLP